MATLGCAAQYTVVFTEEVPSDDSGALDPQMFGNLSLTSTINPLTGVPNYRPARIVGDAENFTELTWDRRLDDTSQATIVIPVNEGCCDDIPELHVWHHGVVIFRDGVQVWDGPIVQIAYRRDSITIIARDLSALLSKRLIRAGDVTPIVAVNPALAAILLISNALRIDGHGYGIVYGGGPAQSASGGNIEFVFNLYDGPIFDMLQELGSSYIDWTVVGRNFLIFDANNPRSRTAVLTCEDFLSNGFLATEDGLAAATFAAAVSDELVGTYAAESEADGVATRNYYGLLEVRNSIDRRIVPDQTSLNLAARNRVRGSVPNPPIVLSSEGAQLLSPDAPVDINELIPSATVPVIANCLCLNLAQDFTLSQMSVSYTPSTGESVSVTLVPTGSTNDGSSGNRFSGES